MTEHYERERHQRQKALDDARENLKGLFTGLVIIGTWEIENGDSAVVSACDGNWYAQNGVARYWLKRREDRASLEAADQHRADSEDAD